MIVLNFPRKSGTRLRKRGTAELLPQKCQAYSLAGEACRVQSVHHSVAMGNTVEPPNNGQVRDNTFVHYSEVSFMQRFFFKLCFILLQAHYNEFCHSEHYYKTFNDKNTMIIKI